MKNFKYILAFIVLGSALLSCSDDESPELVAAIENSPNFAGFVNASGNLSGVADGRTISTNLPVFISGPTAAELTGDVSITVGADASSTAVEGVHFSIPNKTITLTKQGKYVGVIEVVMLTEDIETPLAANPQLVLKVESASASSGKVIASDKPLAIGMLYLCPSELAGDYTVVITRNDGNVYTFAETISETGDGQYRGTQVGHYAPFGLGVGDPGFDFIDVCGVITVPEQNLVNYYSNLVYPVGESSVNEATGVITIRYGITFAAGDRTYTAVYTPE